MFDSKLFRNALGSFVTGVTVVTTQNEDGSKVGITANSFSSVSLSPALVQINLARTLKSYDQLANADYFAINLLSEAQHELCMRFARPGEDKWANINIEKSGLGSPLLPGRLGHFDCKTWARYDGGDHLILVGEVINFHSEEDEKPLIFYRGALQAFDLVPPALS